MAGQFSAQPALAANLPTLLSHMGLLDPDGNSQDEHQVSGAPIFTESVRKYAQGPGNRPFQQYGLLGGDSVKMASSSVFTGSLVAADNDPRIFYNVAAPASVFVCGSQGSGKSHTLSCILENCLIPSPASVLPRPLTGIVFHYDTFVSDTGGAPCEAAYLASSKGVQVRVLCPPTNIVKIKKIYSALPRVTVEELRLDESDLNTKRMLDLMAVSSVQGGGMPLYLHVVTRILRDLRILQQKAGGNFNYTAFRRELELQDLAPGQMGPLQQRLDTLESFMPQQQVQTPSKKQNGAAPAPAKRAGNVWTPKAGQLTIIDLSCPCITQEAACALFNICLSLFLEQNSQIGRIIALDEAHKYMTDSDECATLTETLLATIRLQRHLGTRVVISTQEPTVSPKLLDLCSITIVHRFTSPDWFRSLKQHLAGANNLAQGMDGTSVISTGEGLLFSPSALIGLARGWSSSALNAPFGNESPDALIDLLGEGSGLKHDGPRSTAAARDLKNGSMTDMKPVPLGPKPLKIRVRKRITADGGRTIMAA
ncbi:P-loop containing nucleoside triphosphate hydrolase [Hirsutella rhossiliensis]|uniref:P-loop containing nucleoside triphosphate hydrolase n=1 Tax=Hirsutella rhossiliensis TaxID=111463 RepID=A0A9P8MVE5_9HYPO|nr:P-loop containing nucleoside triphosphate hydrolase [Hirsutella rhossiliensis]KAH0959892.1 P-loop containing nucleoside triphosphate hydrolase [Hirsutella rhossiliensis]